jgi:threonine synthase
MKAYATPLVKFEFISQEIGIDVYGKLEYVNPTGSHKDRESRNVLKDALSKGFAEVAVASTGNAAVSLAAHSVAQGLRCHVFASAKIPEEKSKLISSFGGELHKVEGGLREAHAECVKFVERHGIYDANPGRNFKKIEGDAVIGEEIAAQLEARPSHVFIPTNNGTLLSGIWMGFRRTPMRPRMVAATAPVTEIADSIAGYNRLDGAALDAALGESHGLALKVDDGDIIPATLSLMKEGVFCEPASATSLAALRRLHSEPHELAGPVVLLITGTALKYPSRIGGILSSRPAIR